MNSVVPSCGASLAIQLAATNPPAPGMLRGTTVGLPGNVAADVTRDEPAAIVVVVPDRIADDQADGLAAKEFSGGLGVRRGVAKAGTTTIAPSMR